MRAQPGPLEDGYTIPAERPLRKYTPRVHPPSPWLLLAQKATHGQSTLVSGYNLANARRQARVAGKLTRHQRDVQGWWRLWYLDP